MNSVLICRYSGICDILYDHPEGLDPPFDTLYNHVKSCKDFTRIEAKAGDVFITHGLLPHAHTPNHRHYARVITNPHVNMHVPFNLNRPDGDYVSSPTFLPPLAHTDVWVTEKSLAEQVILRAMGRTSIPEYKATRERITFYPRTAYFKRERVREELERMIKHANTTGEPVDSVYLRGEEALLEHERRNGYDKSWGPTGVAATPNSQAPNFVPEGKKHVLV